VIDLIQIFVIPLERHGLRYLITGSVAAMAYGEPRLTNDIDLILEIREADVDSLVRAFPEADYYLPPAEVIQSERIRPQRGHFNLIHQATMLKADVYLTGSDPLHRRAFQHARRIEIDGVAVAFAPPDYVILRKLEFFQEGGSEKHLRDIAAMVAESGAEIDLAYLDQETQARGLSAVWQQARAMAQG
jgi:predicted nucleotidyltransferase